MEKTIETLLASVRELDATADELEQARLPVDAALNRACEAVEVAAADVAKVERRQITAASLRRSLAGYIATLPGGADALKEYERKATELRFLAERG